MSRRSYLDLARQVLDHELIDADGVPCGMVDDIELDGAPGAELRVVALISGPGAWSSRLPRWICAMLAKLGATRRVRVPWSEVRRIGERIVLARRASELGLGVADRRAAAWITRIPGA